MKPQVDLLWLAGKRRLDTLGMTAEYTILQLWLAGKRRLDTLPKQPTACG